MKIQKGLPFDLSTRRHLVLAARARVLPVTRENAAMQEEPRWKEDTMTDDFDV